jgi:hypothetical protein
MFLLGERFQKRRNQNKLQLNNDKAKAPRKSGGFCVDKHPTLKYTVCMNIFYLDNDTTKCAEYHVDKHVVKMILEYCQLLSTAHRLIDGLQEPGFSKTGRNVKRWRLLDQRDSVLYQATHINHPSAIWARESKENYVWLADLLIKLCKEYTRRYNRIHKCESDGLVRALQQIPKGIRSKGFTQPTPAMPDAYKSDDSILSYRTYYIKDKYMMASWKTRTIPSWYN